MAMRLKDMTFLQVLQLSIFREELEKQLELELQAYNDANKLGKLKRMAMDRLREKNLFDAVSMTNAYYRTVHKETDREMLPANERQYITDVCTMAYTRTIRRIQAEEEYERKHPIMAKLKEWWLLFVALFTKRKEEKLC